MGNSLEERLQQHSNSFDGLLSLIPAKYYYDEETSNQWQQKRKSKQEHQALKRRKLDPESSKNLTAKDVLKETEKTATPVVLPGEKFKLHQQALAKKAQEEQQKEEEVDNDDDVEMDSDAEESGEENKQAHNQEKSPKKGDDEELIQESVSIVFDDNGEEPVGNFKKEALQQQQKQQQKAKGGKKVLTKEEKEERERKHKELKAKLQAKIQSMREKRKAPGTKIPGAATSRQQILEERRKKAEMKKEQRRKVEESSDDEDDDDEDEADDNGTQDGVTESTVMFGNIEFLDGERVSSDLTSSRKVGKKKGPSNKDIKGHLKKIEREKGRIGDMDKDSRRKLEDKNKWQKALASVQGIKVKDDEKLLKKALRRKESKKRKSEREWKDRIQTVADEKKMKTDRREENLRIRKENRGKSRKDQVKQLPSYKRSRSNKKMPGAKRAGFEGGIRSHKKR